MSAVLKHTCTDACGINYDPYCPIWAEPIHPRGSKEWLLMCSAQDRREYDLGRDLCRLLRANRDLVIPVLMELLREEMTDLIRDIVANEEGGQGCEKT